MTPLQWALLILGGLAVLALYVFSRRDRSAMERNDPVAGTEPLLPPAKDKQLDIFNSTNMQFDEFGVGKPRRVTPTIDTAFEDNFEADAGEDGADEVEEPAVPPAPEIREKVISLLIAERDGAPIGGRQLHQVLARNQLEYGDGQIYHRLHQGEIVFSVASLMKPGILDPADAASFSTPGLTLFMVLPGPKPPAEALRDLLGTVDALANALNAETYDNRRAPFTAQTAKAIQADVERWARAS